MRRYLALLVLLTGCDLYFGGGGDDQPPPCKDYGYGGNGSGGAQPAPLRNPQTGECEYFGGGGGCDYDRPECGPCPAYDLGVAYPDWGSCYSACDGLDEQSCLGTTGCQAAYDEDGRLADAPSGTYFKGCWQVPNPQPDGSCWNLDAHACNQHDECAMYYGVQYGPTDAIVGTEFTRCAPEPTTQGCAAVDCGPGSHCEDQCYPCDGKTGPCDQPFCTPVCVPDNYTCANVDCGPGSTCVETCTTMEPTAGGAMPPGQCYPQCVPTGGGDPGACTGQVACDALPPACPTNTFAGILNGCWTGYCIPAAACGPSDPGTCDPAICATPGPACPAGTVGGTKNGCWTGYCIPVGNCPQQLCEALTTDASCSARPDCTSVYAGSDCTCYPGYCDCQTLTFERCESSVMPL